VARRSILDADLIRRVEIISAGCPGSVVVNTIHWTYDTWALFDCGAQEGRL
jgi:hypothetical protein